MGILVLSPSSILKRNPFKIVSDFECLRDKNGTKLAQPKWMNALKLFPPAPPNLLRVDSQLFGQFKKEFDKTDIVNYEKKTNSTTTIYQKRPPQIVYKEDSIRSDFFKVHPFELDSPRVVKDNESSLVENFKRLERENLKIKDFTFNKQVNAESVVQYTKYLMVFVFIIISLKLEDQNQKL